MSSLPSSSLRRAHERRAARAPPAAPPRPSRVRLPTTCEPTPAPRADGSWALCWNCAHSTEETPWRVPTRRLADATFAGIGAFCSPECAKRYALDRMGSRGFERCAYVSELVRAANGVDARCRPAPPFMALDTFGGPLTLAQYRTNFVEVTPPNVVVEYLYVVS